MLSAQDQALDVGKAATAGLSSLVNALGGAVARHGEAVGVFTGLPVPHFNPIHCWRDAADLGADLEATVQAADDAGVEPKIVTFDGAPQAATVAAVAEHHGFVPGDSTSAGMVLVDPVVPSLPSGLVCVSGSEAWPAVGELMAAAFGIPDGLNKLMTTDSVLGAPDTEWFVLSDADGPVAVAMLALADDVAGVFNVGVPPHLRRQGFGTAATWEVVRRGIDQGARVTALESSDIAEPVYQAMGFEEVCRIREFTRP